MLAPLTKVEVVGHQSQLDATLAALQRAALVHVIDGADAGSGAAGYVPSSTEVERERWLSELAARLDALLALVPAGAESVSDAAEGTAGVDLEAVQRDVAARLPLLESTVKMQGELRAEKQTLGHHLASLERLLPLKPELVELSGYDTVALLIDRRHADALELLRAEVRDITSNRFELISGAVDAETTGALLIFPRAQGEAIDTLLARGQITRVRLPREVEGLSFHGSIGAIRARIAAIPERERELEGQLRALGQGAADFRRARRAVARGLDRHRLLRRVGATRHAFVIVGWVAVSRLEGLRRALAAEVGDRVLVAERAPRPGEEPPVLLQNNRLVRPFEGLVRMFSLPRAGALDPTPLVALFLPLFLGLMLGDIGYGLLLLALLRAAWPRLSRGSALLRDVARVVALGAAWAVLWGVIFGELFGDLGHRLFGLQPIWMSREDSRVVAPLMMLSLALGAIHVTLGLILGVWNAWRLRERGKLIERFGLLVALSGLFFVVSIVTGHLPAGLMTPSIALLIVATAVLIGQQGWTGLVSGPLEVLSLVSSVLSYLRIAAIGLASVYLARVANELSARAPIWLGVLIGLLFHALNLALGAFSPTLQALRLHYVEYFGKFHEGGGAEFLPFGAEPLNRMEARQ